MNIVKISFKNVNNNTDNKTTGEECSAGNTRSFDHSHVLLSFLYPVKGGIGASHVYIQTITCCYPKKKVNFWHAIPFFLPVGVKWKVVKNVHCPPLLIDTGLMSIGHLTKKLLQKHRPWATAKNEEKLHIPKVPTESSAESELSRLDSHLRRLVLITFERKTMKNKAVKHDQLILSAVTLFRFFFWGKSIWSYCRLSLNVSRISKTRRAHTVF